MESCKEVHLLIFSFILILVKCENNSQHNCQQIWIDNKPAENVVFSKYENHTVYNELFIVNWRWTAFLNEKWSLYYKEWPRKGNKGIKSGGFVLSNKDQIILTKLNWRVRNDILLWTTTYRKPYITSWNGTICKANVLMKLHSTKRGWTFNLDGVLITGGKSGKKKLNSNSSLSKHTKKGLTSKQRNKRETEDLEGEEKKTVYNKIKGWFKELFDRDEYDNRGWLTRLGDWVLGFLQRVLS